MRLDAVIGEMTVKVNEDGIYCNGSISSDNIEQIERLVACVKLAADLAETYIHPGALDLE